MRPTGVVGPAAAPVTLEDRPNLVQVPAKLVAHMEQKETEIAGSPDMVARAARPAATRRERRPITASSGVRHPVKTASPRRRVGPADLLATGKGGVPLQGRVRATVRRHLGEPTVSAPRLQGIITRPSSAITF